MSHRSVPLQMIMILALACSAAADEIEAQQKSEPEKPSGLSLNGVKDALGLSLTLQASYLYNFENPKDQENSLRVFDHKANSFTVDLAEIQFAHDPQKGEVGYRVKFIAGETAKFIHSLGLGMGDNPIDLTEAYVAYVAPLGSGLTLRFGKFVTYHSAEVIEAKDNINYSRSFLFNYAVPSTHTGLMASYIFGELFTTSLYVVNGWNNTTDNNRAKTFGLSLGLTPNSQWSFVVNFMAGPEQDTNDSDWRFLVDVILTAKPITDLTVILNGDYGRDTIKGNDVSWHGVSLISKYDILSWFGVAMRLEYFNDKNGFTTSVAQELKEVTITTEFRLPMNLILRPEYRHDWSSKASFHNNRSQDTLGVGMIYSW
jgi:hypothetical protein